MGKTETIKQRSIYVYLPSLKQKLQWQQAAKRRGESISKFVIGHVENSLMQEEDSNFKSRGELGRDITKLNAKLREIAREKQILEIAFDRIEKELKRYRAQPFLDEDFVGLRRYQKELVEILREGRFVSNDEILHRLRVDVSAQDEIKAVSKQLENLEEYGLVRSSPKGWKWLK